MRDLSHARTENFVGARNRHDIEVVVPTVAHHSSGKGRLLFHFREFGEDLFDIETAVHVKSAVGHQLQCEIPAGENSFQVVVVGRNTAGVAVDEHGSAPF